MKRYESYFKEKSNQTIVSPDINNGAIVNKLFQQWDDVKNQKDHDSIMKKISDTKFGTYGTATSVLKIIDDWDKGNCGNIKRRDFINEVEQYLKRN